MKLFSKEKGIVLSILNAIFIIWIMSALVIGFSCLTRILVKERNYTYEEYMSIVCDTNYESLEQCKNNYKMYNFDNETGDVENKRNIIVCVANVVLISGVLFILNRKK